MQIKSTLLTSYGIEFQSGPSWYGLYLYYYNTLLLQINNLIHAYNTK